MRSGLMNFSLSRVSDNREWVSLPAFGIAKEVNRLLLSGNRLVVSAPPGAGKSTILPLTMLEAFPQGKILMLEPRRVAARQIAERMAWIIGEKVGETVGYRIRFESKVSRSTRIEVLTEGILSRMLIDDPALEGVVAVIFDEFHERSLQSDEALALTRQSQLLLRDDLRIVVMSATIDTSAIAASLDAPVVSCEGRMFAVDILRHAEEADERNAAELVAGVIRLAHRTREGDILAFLPGEADIRRCAELLGKGLGEGTAVFPLYGNLSGSEQRAAIAPSAPGERKVVLSTPIAETSLTIEGVRVVVDSGLYRRLVYDPRSGLSHLETVRISMDMASQRAGRAGRVAPGVCYRLWSAATEARMASFRAPEILSADLSSLMLDAAAWGENNLCALPWLTPPPAAGIRDAKALLSSLGAIDADGRITPHGKALSALPCHPRIAQMLLRAQSPEEKALAADIAAILEEKDPMAGSEETGLDVRLKAMRRARREGNPGRWSRILRIADQYASMLRVRVENGPVDAYEAGALLAAAYPGRVGHVWKEGTGRFLLSGGEVVAVEPSDPICAAEWIAVASMNANPGSIGRVFLASPVAIEDLMGMAITRDVLFWDSKAGSVVARRETRLGVHLLSEKALSDVPREDVVRVIVEAARKDGLSMFDFTDEVAALQRRIATVASWHPELEIQDVCTESILSQVDTWLPAFIGNARTVQALKKIDLTEVIWNLLPYELRMRIENLAPSHIEVPTGSRIRLDYRQGAEAPVLRVRLQECFGLLDTPRVDGGRVPVLMELLSPGYKPVQLTSDLRSFWEGTYFEVRKELRRRYPKHAWPDNPLQAEPVRGVRH